MAKKRKGRRSRRAKAKRRAAANELWAADGAAPAAAAAAAAPAAAAPAPPPAAAPAPAPTVVQGETAWAQRWRRRSEKAHPRGGANGKRAKVVRDAGADAVALWDVACTMEDMCRLVDAMDAYIDSDGSQELPAARRRGQWWSLRGLCRVPRMTGGDAGGLGWCARRRPRVWWGGVSGAGVAAL